MEVTNSELNKYKNIERFIYKTDNRDGGTFAMAGIIGLMFNAIFGTLFLIIDVIAVSNKTVPGTFLILNLLMIIGTFLYFKKIKRDGSFKYSFFLPGLLFGLSGVYSSVVFLYLAYELLYSAMGAIPFVKNYMTIVLLLYFLIIFLQYAWYFTALKKGFYSGDIVSSMNIERRMTTIAKILFYPVGFLYVAIAPFTYAITRIIVHTVDSYPLKIIIFATVLLVVPFGTAMSYPVFIWWYLIRKYRKYIPEKSYHH